MTPQQKATLQKLGPLIALLVVCIGLAFLSPDFLTVGNVLDVTRQVSINAVISFGMTLTILLGGIDLSVGSILAVASVLTAHIDEGGLGRAFGDLDWHHRRRADGCGERRSDREGKGSALHCHPGIDDAVAWCRIGAVERQPDQRLLQLFLRSAGRRLRRPSHSHPGHVDAGDVCAVLVRSDPNGVWSPRVRYRAETRRRRSCPA